VAAQTELAKEAAMTVGFDAHIALTVLYSFAGLTVISLLALLILLTRLSLLTLDTLRNYVPY
jgi:hypothetical protein